MFRLIIMLNIAVKMLLEYYSLENYKMLRQELSSTALQNSEKFVIAL